MELYLLNLITVGWYPLLWVCLIVMSLGAFGEEPLEHDVLTDRALFVQDLASYLLNCTGIIVLIFWIAGMLLATVHPVLSLASFVLLFTVLSIVADT